MLCHNQSHAQLNIVNQGGSAIDVVNSIISGGLTISNATINCPNDSYGTFTNGATTDIGISTGLILTTGDVDDLNAPGAFFMSTDNWNSCNDPQLTSLEPLATNDCCILEFDITPTCDELQIRFVFGSEEYPEYVNAGFNDAFGFFISGTNPGGGNYNNTNVALLPDGVTIVSIDNVNAGLNAGYYVDNSAGQNNVFDAFTTVLTTDVSVVPCETYHFKLAIADAGDGLYDSGVFVDFLECTNVLETSISATPATCIGNDGTATVIATGGYPNYTYTWNTTPVQSTATATGLAPGIYEVSVDDQGGCTDPIISTVEVLSDATAPTLSINTPSICEGETVTLTATPSENGGDFLWSTGEASSSIMVAPVSTTTYTCDYDLDGCTVIETTTVNVNANAQGTDTQTACDSYVWLDGDTYTSSNNTATYTIVGGAANGCDSVVTLDLTIDPLLTPSFDQLGPFCEGSSIPNINVISNEGISGTWSPAIDNSQTTTYTFTPDAGQCSNIQTLEIVIDPLLTPDFDQVGPYCEGSVIPNLNNSSNQGIIGSWSPTIDNLQTTTYTFTPDAGQCSNTQTMEIVIDPSSTPTFDQVGPYCEGSNPPSLNSLSNEGIIGVWEPPGINTSILGPSVYTFVPDAGQCSNTQTMEVVIDPLLTPSFDQLGPFCEGSSIPNINVISNEGIAGTWSPGINNTQTTTYTFTPDVGLCSNEQTMEIVVDPIITPTFIQQPPICVGDNFNLPIISNEGVLGSWSPGMDNTQTTEYTFVPNAGQCSSEQTMVVSVGPPETPTFAILGPYCESGNIDNLPSTSLEGFTGTWNPSTVDNSTAGIFTSTFTPDIGLCATSSSIDITITEDPSITAAALDSTLCEGESAVIFAMDITGGQLVESFTMNVNAPFTYTTANTNAAGSYYVIVSGTIIAMSGEVRDANYQFILNNNPVNPPVPGCVWQWNGSSVASQSILPFVYNPTHVYNYFFSGGSPQTFTFSDSGPYTDNSGSFVFEIYYMGDLLWSTGATDVADTIVPPAGNNPYTVSIDFGNGCIANDDVEVTVNALDDPTFNAIPPICVGGDVFLPEVSLEGYSGSWSPAIDNTQTTEYMFTPDPGQCASQQFITVEVIPPSVPDFDALGPICSGTLLTLPLESVEGFVGSWSPDVNNTETTTYTFTPDEGQCALNTELIIEVIENPIISAGDPQTVCIGDDIILVASGAGIGGTYAWDNGVTDGVPFDVDQTTTFTVIGTDENGCLGSATILVTALPVPNALFSADPETGGVPLNVVFTNMSENASNYEWDFGNGQFSVVNNNSPQSAVYEDFGAYTVWLIADNGLCYDSTSLIITTTIEPWIFVPNVFTPNEDGSNELFMVSTENMATIELLILNRWGNVMTTIEDLNSGWDGRTPAGNDAKEGVYFYKYVATALDGSEWTGHGFITLIR